MGDVPAVANYPNYQTLKDFSRVIASTHENIANTAGDYVTVMKQAETDVRQWFNNVRKEYGLIDINPLNKDQIIPFYSISKQILHMLRKLFLPRKHLGYKTYILFLFFFFSVT